MLSLYFTFRVSTPLVEGRLGVGVVATGFTSMGCLLQQVMIPVAAEPCNLMMSCKGLRWATSNSLELPGAELTGIR